jgi:hypothetical protein
MDKYCLLIKNRNTASNLAVDGLIYGLNSGVAMYFALALLALLSGGSPGALLERFSGGGLTTPVQGLLSHLAVSAIYGVLFGVFVWPLLRRLSSGRIIEWLGGFAYAAVLLFLAQIAILPVTNSPLGEVHFWQLALGHGVYGLVLGGLFSER